MCIQTIALLPSCEETMKANMKRLLIFILAAGLSNVMATHVYAQKKHSPVAAATFHLSARSLVHKLQRGGYVVYIRHGEREAFKEPDLPDMNDCRTQDNLTTQGRRQAVALGVVFRALKIPIAEVYTGQFCRNKESATLAFGKDTMLPELNRFDARVIPTIKKLLSTAPPAGTNTLIVNHHQALADASGAKLLGYAESAVFLPDGKGGFRLLGYLSLDQLNALARRRGQP